MPLLRMVDGQSPSFEMPSPTSFNNVLEALPRISLSHTHTIGISCIVVYFQVDLATTNKKCWRKSMGPPNKWMSYAPMQLTWTYITKIHLTYPSTPNKCFKLLSISFTQSIPSFNSIVSHLVLVNWITCNHFKVGDDDNGGFLTHEPSYLRSIYQDGNRQHLISWD